MKDARREKLKQLLAVANKVKPERDPRTRAKNENLLVRKLKFLQESLHPTDAEIVRLIRAACLVSGVRGGVPSDALPDDPAAVRRVLEVALTRLGPVTFGRRADLVTPWTIHAAALAAGPNNALDRDALEAACSRESEPGEAAERAATRLREIGCLVDTPLGRVAGVVRKPKKPRPQK